MNQPAERSAPMATALPTAGPRTPAPSLWAATAPPAPATPVLDGDRDADLAVVGGGFTGLSTALHAAEAGASVVLLEAETIGFGASGRNNGQVIPVLSRLEPDMMAVRYPEKGADGVAIGTRFAALVRDSAATTFDLIRRLDLACEAEQTGWLQPVHSPGRLRLAEQRFEAWSRHGAAVELLDEPAMRRRLGSPLYFGGLFMKTGGHINPLAFARELSRAASERGVAIHTGTPVTGMRREGTRWMLDTPRGVVRAQSVVVATNAYTNGPWDDVRRTLVPVVSWQMATRPMPDHVGRTILPGREAASDTRGDLRFFRPTADQRLVTGGALVMGWDGARRVARLVREKLLATFPQLADVGFDYVWNGHIGMTADFAPRVLELGPGAYGWAGCNGRGVALSIALGRELARHIAGADPGRLALPFERPAPRPFHAVLRGAAPFMLARYRWLDARDPNGEQGR